MGKSRLLSALCACAFIFLIAASLRVEAVSVDLSTLGFSDGESVEGITIEDVTFTSEWANLRFLSSGIPPAVVLGFSGNGGGTADIYMDFSSPIESLSITMADSGCNGCDQDAFRVSLFDFDTDALIATTDSPIFGGLPAGEIDIFTLTVSGSNIGRAVIDPGNGGVLPGVPESGGGLLLTTFQYTSVPLPATSLLFGSGLLGMIGIARRKKAA